jgi:hypothetical protein
MKLKFISAVVAVALGLTACGSDSTTAPTAPVTPGSLKFNVGVIGDLPYGLSPTDTSQFLAAPAFLKTINDDKDLSFVIHGGDIHSGKEYCTEAYDRSIYSQLTTAITLPIVYTPGDNEWADCHKVKQGGGSYSATTGAINYVLGTDGKPVSYASGDPLANLTLVRQIFFPTPGKTIGGSMTVHSQAIEYDTKFPTDKEYVENVWFIKNNIMFLTLNVPGGSNNDNDIWYGTPLMSAAQTAEIANRTSANIRWLTTAFTQAAANKVAGVVITVQGDMWDPDTTDFVAGRAHLTQHKPLIDAMAATVKTFGNPVLLLNGDSHAYRSDNPFVSGFTCVKDLVVNTAGVGVTSGVTVNTCADVTGLNVYGTDAYLNQPGGYYVPNFHRVTWHGSTLPMEYLKLTIDPSVNYAHGIDAFGPFKWTRMVKP